MGNAQNATPELSQGTGRLVALAQLRLSQSPPSHRFVTSRTVLTTFATGVCNYAKNPIQLKRWVAFYLTKLADLDLATFFLFFSKTGASLSDERVEVYKFYLSPVVFTVRNPSRTMFFEGSKLHLSLIIGVNINYNWQTNVKME